MRRAIIALTIQLSGCSFDYSALRSHPDAAIPSGAGGSAGSALAGAAGGGGTGAGGSTGTAGVTSAAGTTGRDSGAGGALCGDGIVQPSEVCDDGNTVAGDGCGPTCQLESKPSSAPEGWLCTSPRNANGSVGPTSCTTTTCGNKIKEGTEQCDDGNTVTGDGCSPFCRLEPACPSGGGACATTCGDGLLFPIDKANGQECDDGNTVDGDGCSSTCKVEPGYACADTPVRPNPLVLPIVYRDFKGWNEAGGHPDFERVLGDGDPATALPMLGAANGGVPVHVNMCMAMTTNLCTPPAGANPTWDPSVDWFGMWYVDNATYNKPIVQSLVLAGQVGGVNSTTCNTAANPACTSYEFNSGGGFFPLDGMGWGNGPNPHNFGFTSEVRYWFQYMGSATIAFTGDDDAWIYINRTLAVDLGGVHKREQGSITLDAMDGMGYSCDFVAPGPSNTGGCNSVAQTGGGHVVNLGLTLGSVYEIAVFQAERHTTSSDYLLTLTGAPGTHSACSRTP